MNHLVTIPRHQAVLNYTLRRLLTNAASGNPITSLKGNHTKVHPSWTDKNEDPKTSKSQSTCRPMWSNFYGLNSSLRIGNKSKLISNYENSEDQNQAVPHCKENSSDLNNSKDLKKLKFYFPDNNKYIANWNNLLNNTYEGLLGYKVSVLSHLKQPLGPLPPCSRNFHTSTCQSANRPAPLPPYEPPRDALGLTYISDLNEEDAERIKNVAYEELKLLLEKHNIAYTKTKAKKRTTDSGLFGTALEVLVAKDIKKNRLVSDLKVPAVFSLMVRFIEENGMLVQGIFRVPGSAERIKAFRKELEENFYKIPNYSIYDHTNISELTVHEVSSAFKAFLRELPAYLISSERMECFPNIKTLPFTEQIKATNMFILSMKEEYRDTLQVFLRLMNLTIENKSVTQMDDQNLATCHAPNVFAMPKGSETDMTRINDNFGYFKTLTNYNKKLFAVPPNFISQIRQQYATGVSAKPKRKFISKLLGKKSKGEEIPPPREELMRLKEVQIEVHAPQMTRESAVITINESTTAKDVIYQYEAIPKTILEDARRNIAQGENEDRAIEYLCEVGGNIGERCLDPEAKVLEVYRVNPTAEWMIKTKKGR
ncbi:rho GTPase-activating protein 18-like isoform X1 [Biomphalaria glabrata]|uniref:Rho GTPase-activating protein 18-like isoform X1 n=1 Tax=Biomphalaria glabrata TaxID=6526 RepID=A0A9W2Z7L5_BIOGL|nr:rho GTPase-activating protein 18-like isoform X1 [Biomphalaria glabrata]